MSDDHEGVPSDIDGGRAAGDGEDEENASRTSSPLLTDEQLAAVSDLSSSAKKPEKGRFARFRDLHGRQKADYFRQEFMWPLIGIVIAIAMVISITTSIVSSKSKKTGLQIVSFDTVMTPAQADKLAAHLNKKGTKEKICADPIRLTASYELTGQASIKLRLDASAGSVDVVIATASAMKKIAGQGYLAPITSYAPKPAQKTAVSYRGMYYGTDSGKHNKPGKGPSKPYALPLSHSANSSVRSLRSKDGQQLQIGVFVKPAHPTAVKNLIRLADIR